MSWIRRRARAQKSLRVTVYSKPGCHLCNDALELLQRLSAPYTVMLNEVDIRSDPDLFRRYDVRIPVFLFDDGSTVDAPVRESELRRAMKRNAGRG